MPDGFHSDDPESKLDVLVADDDASLSFVGRGDTETVTLYAFDMAENKPLFPILECDADRFEFLLEQASGALIDARGETDA